MRHLIILILCVISVMSRDLVDIIVIKTLIKEAVEVVEKVNDLVCRAVRGDVGEANDIAEKDGRFIEHL